LEQAGLIEKHSSGTAMYPIYVADRALVRKDYRPELRGMFGVSFDALDGLLKDVMSIVYRFNHYSKSKFVSAKLTSFNLWYTRGGAGDIKEFDAFYRKVRRAFNELEKSGFVRKQPGTRGYLLSQEAADGSLKPVSTV
jgi:hypothetical protein